MPLFQFFVGGFGRKGEFSMRKPVILNSHLEGGRRGRKEECIRS
jgi:hypothetical protein